MRSFLPVAACVVACSVLPAQADFDRAAFMRMAMSTVRIEALAPDSHYNMGTGVIVGPGRVVTSCHVTGPAPSVRVLYGGLRHNVKLQRADIQHDLCMLDVPEIDGPPATVGSTGNLQLGDQVIAMGFTGGYELQFADGVVRGLQQADGLPIIKSSTAFNSGASGGGLFDAEGRLVGILTFRLRGTEDCYYSMPVDWFKSWVGSKEGFEPTRLLDEAKPVWQETIERQPLFLQAAALELTRNWTGLHALGEQWTRQEPGNAEAWLTLGKSEEALHHSQDAAAALRKATEVEPRLAEAWYALGKHYTQAHLEQERMATIHTLENLDPALAAQLSEAAPATTESH